MHMLKYCKQTTLRCNTHFTDVARPCCSSYIFPENQGTREEENGGCLAGFILHVSHGSGACALAWKCWEMIPHSRVKLQLVCISCNSICWKHAMILKAVVWGKTDSFLSLHEIVSDWKMWHSELCIDKGHLVIILQGLSVYFKHVLSGCSLRIRQWLKNLSLKHWGW